MKDSRIQKKGFEPVYNRIPKGPGVVIPLIFPKVPPIFPSGTPPLNNPTSIAEILNIATFEGPMILRASGWGGNCSYVGSWFPRFVATNFVRWRVEDIF